MENSAEEFAKGIYEHKGYVVLNRNDKGFPDLIVIKDGGIASFVEVKSWQDPEKSLTLYQIWYHQYLKKLGFRVKCINVNLDERKLTEFQPAAGDLEVAKLREEQNPYRSYRT